MRAGLLVLVLALPAIARADDDLPPLPVLPAPHPVVVETLPPVTGFYRASPMDVWKLYAVDRRGGFKPRVVLAPGSPYYLATGEPYPLLNVKPMNFMPYLVD
jgi:hypothetical protein